jgi:predicted nucleic acid-binding protein
MSFSNFSGKDQPALILDTSVLINLHSCGSGEKVLAAVPSQVLISDIVATELENETSIQNGQRGFVHRMVEMGTVILAELNDDEYELFQELTCQSPSLGDGEASTIAVAVRRKIMPVMDDLKARIRAAALLPNLPPGWSFDILRHPQVIAALGEKLALETLYLALSVGRMRIPTEVTDEVVAYLGISRSRDCKSLPGYRERFRANPDLASALGEI